MVCTRWWQQLCVLCLWMHWYGAVTLRWCCRCLLLCLLLSCALPSYPATLFISMQELGEDAKWADIANYFVSRSWWGFAGLALWSRSKVWGTLWLLSWHIQHKEWWTEDCHCPYVSVGDPFSISHVFCFIALIAMAVVVFGTLLPQKCIIMDFKMKQAGG